MRYLVQLQYKGTHYHGWQLQPNANTVQAEINKALSIVFSSNIETVGCGRTDTGVHASKYIAHFDLLHEIIDSKRIIRSLDLLLPKDISVDNFIKVNDDFHARFDATSRTYHYFINRFKSPFINEFSTRIFHEIDIDKMNEAAKILFKYEDFSCFSKANTQTSTNNCKIYLAEWIIVDKNQYRFEIKANRFLRNMVRAIVGSMLLVGEGKITVSEFEKIILSKDRKMAGKSVDACGLFLVDVSYPNIY